MNHQSEDKTNVVVVKLELGHTATPYEKPENFTHKWTVFVKGADGVKIEHFVDKVIFNLHESFDNPRRVVSEPPYSVTESGYASFIMMIEVHFKNKEDPKKVAYKYDLYLLKHDVTKNIRVEKLTFHNPSEDFEGKLLKAGGVPVSGGSAGGKASLSTEAYVSGSEDHQPKLARSSVSEKKIKNRGKNESNSRPPSSVSKASQPLSAIFGAAISAESSQDSISKKKESGHSSRSKSSSGRKEEKSSKESHKGKVSPKESHKDKFSPKESHKGKISPKESHKSKISQVTSKEAPNSKKDYHQYDADNSHPHKDYSTSSDSHLIKDSHVTKAALKEHSRDGHKSKDSPKSTTKEHSKDVPKSRDSHNPLDAANFHKEKQPRESNEPKPSKSLKDVTSSQKRPASEPSNSHGGSVKKKKKHDSVKSHGQKVKTQSKPSKSDSVRSEQSCSPFAKSLQSSPKASPVSFSHSPKGSSSKANTPSSSNFGLSERSDSIISPICSDTERKHSEHNKSNSETVSIKSKVERTPKSPDSNHGENGNVICSSTNSEKLNSASDISPYEELKTIQRVIMSSTDRRMLQSIVDVIEKTGKYHVTDKTFDFDLCSLNPEVISKIKQCLYNNSL